MAKVLVYLRVSTTDQAESGLGLEAQLAACQQWADKNGGVIEAVFRDEGISGAKGLDKRPGLLEAIGALAKGDVLLVAKRDRLGRDAMVLAMVEASATRKKARIVSAAGEGTDNDDPSAVLMRRMIDAFGEYERLVIRARTRAAMAAKNRRGERCWGSKYGFQVVQKGLVADDQEAKTLDRIRTLRTSGLSLRKICATLVTEGVPTKNGRPWHPATVAGILERTA